MMRRHEVLCTADDLIVALWYLEADIRALSPNAAHLTKGAVELLEEVRKNLESALKRNALN
jgi:hypothetical protein